MWETLVFGKEEGRPGVVDYETSEFLDSAERQANFVFDLQLHSQLNHKK